ncbi:hypothetical protein CJF59_00210 [Acetobacter pomorum]|uniref:Uncharacterized protein n=1 Tax=Acetobacter pomorum TaxID=65959 RepID=A0AAN1U7V9_9PROT|nr:hypothetical protein CJF59_00210 [Acetobacter pomorum]
MAGRPEPFGSIMRHGAPLRSTPQHAAAHHFTSQRYGEQSFGSVPRNGAYRSTMRHSASQLPAPLRAATQHNEKTGGIMLPVT